MCTPQGRPLKLASSGSRDVPLVRSSIYHPGGRVDPRGAIAAARRRQGQMQMLTYWEERNPGKPSRQQRWYQYMSNQDAGPMVGALGAGWDGVDRAHMFPGEGAVLDPEDPRYGALAPVPRCALTRPRPRAVSGASRRVCSDWTPCLPARPSTCNFRPLTLMRCARACRPPRACVIPWLQLRRFPESEADQKWIYRDAPEEMGRPYRVEAQVEPTFAFEAPEEGVLKGFAVGDADRYQTAQVIKQEAARTAGQVADPLSSWPRSVMCLCVHA